MANAQLALQLRALADPARLRILGNLEPSEECEKICNVSELAQALHIPQPTISHHLLVLHRAGIVRRKKVCRDVYYWIDPRVMDAVETALRFVLLKGRKR